MGQSAFANKFGTAGGHDEPVVFVSRARTRSNKQRRRKRNREREREREREKEWTQWVTNVFSVCARQSISGLCTQHVRRMRDASSVGRGRPK